MHFPICFFLQDLVLILFQKLSIIFLPAKGRNLTTRFILKMITVKQYEILEQQITTSKPEGIHNCADRTEKFVSN